nr:RNA methyltransferase [Pyrinomonadaceae bacterium]
FGKNERETVLFQHFGQLNKQINSVENKLFQTIADTHNSQGIVVIAEKPKNSFDELPMSNHFIFLHEINNPSNLGAILRTAEAAGINGIIISKNSTDVFSPKAIRASMGSVFRLPIWEKAEFEEVLSWAKLKKLMTTAADIKAENTIWETDWKQKRLIIFGSEADGLSEEKLSKIDEMIYVPMENAVESLNLAVSCGVILFEAKRQRN